MIKSQFAFSRLFAAKIAGSFIAKNNGGSFCLVDIVYLRRSGTLGSKHALGAQRRFPRLFQKGLPRFGRKNHPSFRMRVAKAWPANVLVGREVVTWFALAAANAFSDGSLGAVEQTASSIGFFVLKAARIAKGILSGSRFEVTQGFNDFTEGTTFRLAFQILGKDNWMYTVLTADGSGASNAMLGVKTILAYAKSTLIALLNVKGESRSRSLRLTSLADKTFAGIIVSSHVAYSQIVSELVRLKAAFKHCLEPFLFYHERGLVL